VHGPPNWLLLRISAYAGYNSLNFSRRAPDNMVCQLANDLLSRRLGPTVTWCTGRPGATHWMVRCPQNRKPANHAILCRCTVRCAPDSPVHPRTKGNQTLPNGALTAPRYLRAIKGTSRRMEHYTKNALNILRHRDTAITLELW
jgi:hypothetical protein